jgi:hypothetical protein
MTGREDDLGRTLRSLLLEETNAMPVDTHDAGQGLRRRLAYTRTRRRVTLAVAASVIAAVVATVAGGWLGVNKDVGPAEDPAYREAVEVARGFLDAYGSFDADRALTYLTDDYLIPDAIAGQGSNTPEQFRLGVAHARAIGYKQTIYDCEQQGNSDSEVILRCAFDMHALGSDKIGLGPYTDNYWDLTIRDGKIDSVDSVWGFMSNGFSDQMWEPFAYWVSVEHPGDVEAMYTDLSQIMEQVTQDSIPLWEQRTAEYIAVVNQNPAAYLDQPEVGAYVAQLESICAAAQARVKDEIQAIPQPNQPALIEAHERIMRETIPKLRRFPLPEAVRWSYEGRAFPLMKEFSQYGKGNEAVPPQERQPETLLLNRIRLIPGLDKC